jgi:hypothetical protein
MGFPIVEIRLPDFDGEVRLERWLVPLGEYVKRDKPVAQFIVGREVYRLFCNMPVVMKEIMVKSSAKVEPGQLVGRASAEGHEIPYDRPYTRIEKLS